MQSATKRLLSNYAMRIAETADDLPDEIMDARDKQSLHALAAEWVREDGPRPALRDIVRIFPSVHALSVQEVRSIALMQDMTHAMRHVLLADTLALLRAVVLDADRLQNADGMPNDAASKLVAARNMADKAADAVRDHMIGVKRWSGSRAVAEDACAHLDKALDAAKSADAALTGSGNEEATGALISSLNDAVRMLCMQN